MAGRFRFCWRSGLLGAYAVVGPPLMFLFGQLLSADPIKSPPASYAIAQHVAPEPPRRGPTAQAFDAPTARTSAPSSPTSPQQATRWSFIDESRPTPTPPANFVPLRVYTVGTLGETPHNCADHLPSLTRTEEQPRCTLPEYKLPARVAENGSYYGQLNRSGIPKTVHVRGYFRRDGTYVRGHYRSPPRSNP